MEKDIGALKGTVIRVNKEEGGSPTYDVGYAAGGIYSVRLGCVATDGRSFTAGNEVLITKDGQEILGQYFSNMN